LRELDAALRAEPSNLLALHLRAAVLLDGPAGPQLEQSMAQLEAALRGGAKFADGHILLARYHRAAGRRYLLAQIRRARGETQLASEELARFEELRRQESHGSLMMRQLFYGETARP
jgi:hypothetical protein